MNAFAGLKLNTRKPARHPTIVCNQRHMPRPDAIAIIPTTIAASGEIPPASPSNPSTKFKLTGIAISHTIVTGHANEPRSIPHGPSSHPCNLLPRPSKQKRHQRQHHQLVLGRNINMSSATPSSTISVVASSVSNVMCWPIIDSFNTGSNANINTSTNTHDSAIARPPDRGIGRSCTLRAFGRSTTPNCVATDMKIGVRINDAANAYLYRIYLFFRHGFIQFLMSIAETLHIPSRCSPTATTACPSDFPPTDRLAVASHPH